MNNLAKGGLALGSAMIAFGALRRYLNPPPRYAPWEKPRYGDFEKKVLIVGGGFGGYTAATKLCEYLRKREDVGVLVIARDNYFTFWPMVPGIVSSDIDTRNVAQPLRRALIRAGASFRRAQLKEVNHEKKTITADGGLEFPYDQLIVSLGGQPNFFGIPGVEEYSLTMRGISDAERIRNRVIERFEEVSLIRGPVPDSKLTFVVIGAGATGVEVATEIHALVHEALEPDYPNIDPARVKIVLLEGLPEILAELDPVLQKAARGQLFNLHIDVRTSTFAEEVTADRVILDDGREIETENVIWTAGNRASSKVEDLDLPQQGEKGIEADEYMRVKGYENVWAIGDCAANVDKDGEPVPPNAQAASQEGQALARNILATIDGEELTPFEYEPMGQLVELGSQFAVNEVMGVKFKGLPAALFWRATYLFKLEMPENRARIAADWLLDLFFHPSVTQIRGR